MRRRRLSAIAVLVVATAAVAGLSVVDIGAKKLLVRTGAKSQLALVSNDAGVQAAGVGDPSSTGVAIHVYGGTDDVCVELPGGAGWKSIKKGGWRYKAPKGVVLVKDGKLVLNLKSGFAYTLAAAGSSGAINVQVQFGGSSPLCVHCTGNKKDEATKLLAKSCVAAACDAAATTCGGVTTTTTVGGGTTTTTLGGSAGFRGVLPQKTTGRFNFAATLGVPGADAACNAAFAGSHACTYAELQAAEAAGQLVGVSATSFWAIIPEHAHDLQCATNIPWDYQTAHTGEYGEKITLNGTTGVLGPLESGSPDGVFCAGQSSVGCCQ
jgi:hypothetical protein